MYLIKKLESKLKQKSFREVLIHFIKVRTYPTRKYLRRYQPIKSCDYDELTRRIMKQELTSVANCVDIGCHKGDILKLILQYAPKGTHYAMEPIPSMMAALKVMFPHVYLYEVALSNEVGESTFELVTNHPGYSGLKQRPYEHDDVQIEQISVKTEKLDNIIPEQTKIDLIKIDIEGGEFWALQGAKRVLMDSSPLVIFENGHGPARFYDFTRRDLYAFLEGCQMQISSLQGWLLHEEPLTIDSFHESKEWMFIAHPIV